MLGKLATYIAMPAPGIDYSREPSSPIEMFVEKVLLPAMMGRLENILESVLRDDQFFQSFLLPFVNPVCHLRGFKPL